MSFSFVVKKGTNHLHSMTLCEIPQKLKKNLVEGRTKTPKQKTNKSQKHLIGKKRLSNTNHDQETFHRKASIGYQETLTVQYPSSNNEICICY